MADLSSGFVSFALTNAPRKENIQVILGNCFYLSQILKDFQTLEGGWWEVNHEYESTSLHPYIQNAVARIFFFDDAIRM